MTPKIARRLLFLFQAGFLLAASSASAQTVAYRQTNLASDIPNFANNLDPFLKNAWGIAAVPGLSFTISNQGRAISLDATGSRVGSPAFAIPNPAGTGPATPTGIVADTGSLFKDSAFLPPFSMSTITATEDGGIYFWAVNADGTVLPQANLVVNHSQLGAVYTSLAILTPDCCAPFLAVANFHTGRVETFSTDFAPLGSFLDPSLPPGFAPYGMQVIGNQLFVASAVQDAAKHDPVAGAGNGIISVFDLEGGFVRRFATAGPLNVPWGIAQASANFGPFSNDILIGNAGDGTISAFDPVTGNFAGQIKDGDGNLLVIAGLHALMFRSDRVGDPNSLYFTAGTGNGQDGLFGALTAGLVSTTRVSVPSTPAGTAAQITVTVSAGPGNSGMPKGMVALEDGGVAISEVALTNGGLVFSSVLRGVSTHVISARYLGDDTFLPSFSQTQVEVTGPSTTLTLAAPTSAAPGSPVTLTATINSTGGTPTGQIVFHDGNTILGTAPLNANGVAALTISTLAAGTHSLTASYEGDGSFGGSASAEVNTTVASRDFSLNATPPAATVTAGQSTSFSVMVTPAGGFADPVTFSCPVLAGITCSFSPPTITPNAGTATTMLTITTSAGVTRYGNTLNTQGPGIFLAGLAFIGILALVTKTVNGAFGPWIRTAAGVLSVFTLAVFLVSCGGYTTSAPTSRGTASVTVTAQSGAVSHATSVSVTVQ